MEPNGTGGINIVYKNPVPKYEIFFGIEIVYKNPVPKYEKFVELI